MCSKAIADAPVYKIVIAVQQCVEPVELNINIEVQQLKNFVIATGELPSSLRRATINPPKFCWGYNRAAHVTVLKRLVILRQLPPYVL